MFPVASTWYVASTTHRLFDPCSISLEAPDAMAHQASHTGIKARSPATSEASCKGEVIASEEQSDELRRRVSSSSLTPWTPLPHRP